MEKERSEYEAKVRQEYEQQILDKEEALIEKLFVERVNLLEERQIVEEQLQQQMEQQLDKKNKLLEADLLKEKQKLDAVIQKKELEHKMLECQLELTKTENMKQQEDALRIKEDVLSNFAELMETELQCSICNELFVQVSEDSNFKYMGEIKLKIVFHLKMSDEEEELV